jgi:hypothetical protein
MYTRSTGDVSYQKWDEQSHNSVGPKKYLLGTGCGEHGGFSWKGIDLKLTHFAKPTF